MASILASKLDLSSIRLFVSLIKAKMTKKHKQTNNRSQGKRQQNKDKPKQAHNYVDKQKHDSEASN